MEKQEMQVEWNLKHKVEMEKGNVVIYSDLRMRLVEICPQE